LRIICFCMTACTARMPLPRTVPVLSHNFLHPPCSVGPPPIILCSLITCTLFATNAHMLIGCAAPRTVALMDKGGQYLVCVADVSQASEV
jgi:hypothetical protein